jgi:hypothetical protein
MARPHNGLHGYAHRVIAALNREQVDYLDKLGKDAQFSSGLKLSRTEILAAMVNALKRLNLTGEGVRTAEQFEQRIVDAILPLTGKTSKGSMHRAARAARRTGDTGTTNQEHS